MADGLRAALPGVTVTDDDGTDLEGPRPRPASADVALVVVGYTRLDEGEYIGEFATTHLTDLFPGEDDPDLVERFHARSPPSGPSSRRPTSWRRPRPGGFAVGRRPRRPCTSTRTTWPSSARCRRPTPVPWWPSWPGARWSSPNGTGRCRPWSSRGTRAWRAATAWPMCCSGRVDASGRLPFSVPRSESDLPAFDAEADRVRLRRLARVLASGEQGIAPAYPFGFGLSYTTFVLEAAEVTVVDGAPVVGSRSRNAGRADRAATWSRSTPTGRARPPGPAGRVRPGRTRGRGAVTWRSPCRSPAWPCGTSAPTPWWSGPAATLRVAHHADDPGISLEAELG